MTISATELKNNLGHYLEQAEKEDILITKNGKNIARLTSPNIDKLTLWKSILGSVPGGDDVDIRKARDERLGF